MSDIDIQVVLSSRYRTSQQADQITSEMWQALGLETKAQFARLAIGRSLAMGKLQEDTPDAKGIEVPAQALFSVDNVGAWIGLMVTHAITTGADPVASQDTLRSAIRCHWHRGAIDLWRDWKDADENYDKFVDVLISRRSEMPEESERIDELGNGSDISGPTTPRNPDGEAHLLVKGLDQLNIKVQVKEAIDGPRLTRYRVLLVNLQDANKIHRSLQQLALAMNLGDKLPAISNGDEPMTMFIDVPRPRNTWSTVGADRLKKWADSSEINAGKLNAYLGVSVTGEDTSFDLAQAPHLLVGGSTGSGKSVCLHSIILSLLLKHRSNTLQLALIDPKRVEFNAYVKLKNLYRGSIATEFTEAREMLEELVTEMDARYALFESLKVSNLAEAREKGQKLPFIVVFIEEMADLVLQDKNVEQPIVRLAQKARAAGIHLVLATQRPDSETFSGLIRSNIPARVALMVQKGSESRIILDEVGAENLLGHGDMLLKMPGDTVKRAHGVLIRQENISQLLAGMR